MDCPSENLMHAQCELEEGHEGPHTRGILTWTVESIRDELADYERRGGVY